jgi:hypothetical protein
MAFLARRVLSAAVAGFSELDYRFGWRWLLPDSDGDLTVSVGLVADEEQWWVQTQSRTLVSIQANIADGYLIALDTVDPAAMVESILKANPRWLCAWGSGTSVSRFRSSLRRFGSVREYALLPAGKPRVVVPLSSPKNAAAGLRLHRPGRLLARFGLLVACGLARLGHYGLLRGRVLLIATREGDAVPRAAAQAGMNTSSSSGRADYALYLGTPDDNRKTVVLPLGDAPPSVILKVAEALKPRAALQNEARALAAMSMTSLAEQVPILIGLGEAGARLTLAQEFRQCHSVGRTRMTCAAISFLAGLSEIDRKQVALADWLQVEERAGKANTKTVLSSAAEDAVSKLRARLGGLATEGKQIWLHRCHGDFAPWNCAWTDRGLFVYDWEGSRKHGLACGDAFYYILSACVHVRKSADAEKALVRAIGFGAEVATQSGLFVVSDIDCAADVRLYLALWLWGRLDQSPFYSELLVRLVRGWK